MTFVSNISHLYLNNVVTNVCYNKFADPAFCWHLWLNHFKCLNVFWIILLLLLCVWTEYNVLLTLRVKRNRRCRFGRQKSLNTQPDFCLGLTKRKQILHAVGPVYWFLRALARLLLRRRYGMWCDYLLIYTAVCILCILYAQKKEIKRYHFPERSPTLFIFIFLSSYGSTE